MPDLIMTTNLSTNNNNNVIIIVKKIFKLRYSSSSFFKNMYQLCWFMGIDSPVLIPDNIVSALDTKQINQHLVIDDQNENSLLNSVLNNLYTYQQPEYEMVPTYELPDNSNGSNTKDNAPLLRTTYNEKTIDHLKYELFAMTPRNAEYSTGWKV